MIRIPTLCLNDQQPHAWNDHNEIRVSVGDHRFVVDNYVVRQLLEKLKHPFLAALALLGRRSGIISAMRIPSIGYFFYVTKVAGVRSRALCYCHWLSWRLDLSGHHFELKPYSPLLFYRRRGPIKRAAAATVNF